MSDLTHVYQADDLGRKWMWYDWDVILPSVGQYNGEGITGCKYQSSFHYWLFTVSRVWDVTVIRLAPPAGRHRKLSHVIHVRRESSSRLTSITGNGWQWEAGDCFLTLLNPSHYWVSAKLLEKYHQNFCPRKWDKKFNVLSLVIILFVLFWGH